MFSCNAENPWILMDKPMRIRNSSSASIAAYPLRLIRSSTPY